jgi:hypothetical protein
MSEFVRYTEPYRRELIAHGSRRVLPSGLGGPADDPHSELEPAPNVTWLQVIPDSWVDDPAAVDTSRESLRLALVASLQHLPAQQTPRCWRRRYVTTPRWRWSGRGRGSPAVRPACRPCRSGWRAG